MRFTYAEFDREVERVARGMIACGLEPGERIGIWAPNCAEWVLTMFAAARAGLVLVNLNPAYRTMELDFALRLVGCRALVFAPRFKSSDYAGMLRVLDPRTQGAPRPAGCCARRSRTAPAGSIGDGPAAGHAVVRRPRGRRPRSRRDGAEGHRGRRRIRTTSTTSSSPAAPPARRRARR